MGMRNLSRYTRRMGRRITIQLIATVQLSVSVLIEGYWTEGICDIRIVVWRDILPLCKPMLRVRPSHNHDILCYCLFVANVGWSTPKREAPHNKDLHSTPPDLPYMNRLGRGTCSCPRGRQDLIVQECSDLIRNRTVGKASW